MTRLSFTDKTPTAINDRYWTFCVGSGHASLALRADYQAQLKRAHDELGFRYVRFHGLFDDDMKVITRLSDFMSIIPGSKRVETVSFYHIGLIIDMLLEIGMKPFLELSFMPTALAKGKRTVFYYKGNITMPKSLDRWQKFIGSFVEFLIDRYGRDEVESWFFEVWNEPDLKNFFFAGTQRDYFELYKATVTAIKAVDPRLKVGGPATSDNRWISDMKAYCEKEGVPLDFISTHHYPGDDVGLPLFSKQSIERLAFSALKNPKADVNTVLNKMLYTPEKLPLIERDSMVKQVERAKAQAGDTPLYYTEWNVCPSCTAPLHDSIQASAFALKHVLDCQYKMEGCSYWTFSDIFEELTFFTKPFSGSFGLMNIHGIPKASYWAFYLLNRLGDERYLLPTTHEQTELAAFKKGKTLQLLVYRQNYCEGSDIPNEIEISLDIRGKVKACAVTKIDRAHGNPKALWEEMGSPPYLSGAQVEEIKRRSEPVREPMEIDLSGEKPLIKTALADNDIQLIEIETE